MRCPICIQGDMLKVLVKANNDDIYICDECGSVAINYYNLIHLINWYDLEGYLKEHSIVPSDWDDMFILPKPKEVPKLHEAAYYNNSIEMKNVLMNNIDINLKDENYKTALHYAASQDHMVMVEYLIENGAIIDAVDDTGETPLFNAVYKGLSKIIEYFIKKGSDVNIRNIYGQTPLHVAVRGSMNGVSLLLKYGANDNIKDNAGDKPIDIAKHCYRDYDYIELLKKYRRINNI